MARSPDDDPSVLRTAVLLGLLVALTILGSSAVAVALPTVGEELGLDVGGTAWILAVFSLGISVATAVFGRVADLVGLRTPLRIGIVTFATGSLVAAAAPSFPVLLAGRVLQGIGAGAVPVLVIGIIVARLEGARRVRALGTVTAVVSLVSGSGPLVGGLLASVGSWRLVLGLPVLALLLLRPVGRLAPTAPAGDPGERLDLVGAGLTAVLVIGLVLLLQSPSTRVGAPVVAGAAAAMAVAAALLVRHVGRRPDGFVPVAVVGNRRLLLLAAIGFGLLAAYLGLLLAIPQLLRADRGWDVLRIGLTMLPAAAAGALASRLTPRLLARVGRDRVLIGLTAAAAGGVLLAAVGAPSPVALVAGLALTAVGFGVGQATLIEAVPELVAPSYRGVALGLHNLVFFTGGAVGSATTGGLSRPLGLAGALTVLAAVPAASLAAALVSARLSRTPARPPIG